METMTTYRELAPVPGLGLACVWTQRVGPTYPQRVLPDGCMDILWSRSEGTLQVAGPDTVPRLVVMAEGTDLVALRFLPGRAPAVLAVAADALRDTTVPLAELWGDGAHELAAALSTAPAPRATSVVAGGQPTIFYDSDPGFNEGRAAVPGDAVRTPGGLDRDTPTAGTLLQRAVAARMTMPDPIIAVAARALRGPGSIADTADRLGLSERQLRRRCLTAFGYGPKTLQRILRFQRALTLARSGMPLADTAVETGYVDQAHLSHEVRRLAGVPLGELTSQVTISRDV